MIFQATWQQVLAGTKTQTRRLVRPGDTYDFVFYNVVFRNGRLLWEVGRTYALQPGRGKPAVGRIQITGIRIEGLQSICDADAVAEGCIPGLLVRHGSIVMDIGPRGAFAVLWGSIHSKPGTRWVDSPMVYVLTFRLEDA